MLPVYKKPVVQYVVEEAMYAGLTDVVFVNNQNKRVLEDHFDYNLALEGVLERAGKTDLLKEVRSVAEMVNIISVRQKQQLGLGHAVLTAREAVGDEPFAVMVGDDLMFGMEPGIQQLLEVYHSEKLPVIGVVQVPADKVDQYGIIQADEFAPGLYRVRDLVEKPAVGQAPSRLAIVGRYVLLPEMFDHLAAVEPGHGGEIQLTDALRVLARNNRLLAVRLRGQRFDTGDWAEYLTANIYFALQDEELRADLVERLEELLPPRK
jgi:UTP--glucose-1-phosphate uridylyltransferase